MQGRTILIALLLSTWLSGCQAGGGSPPVSPPTGTANQAATTAAVAQASQLPNILVAGEGVKVRRLDSLDFVPIALGAELRPGDVVRVDAAPAAIFCGAEQNWETSPLALAAGKTSGVACGAGRPPRPYADASAVRGEAGDTGTAAGLTVLSPRSGAVLRDRPTLAWEELDGVAGYTVTLESDDEISRVTTASGSPLPYPAEWEPLQGEGASYRLVVAANGVSSGEDTPGFSRLENADEVLAKQERLQARPLAEPARSLLLAELYLSYGLRSEAIELLNAAPGADTTPAVQRLLGDTYWNMELVARAQAAYTRLLELAQAGGYVEAQGEALVGLGRVACALRQADRAEQYWSQARQVYEQNGQRSDAETLAPLLASVSASCR